MQLIVRMIPGLAVLMLGYAGESSGPGREFFFWGGAGELRQKGLLMSMLSIADVLGGP